MNGLQTNFSDHGNANIDVYEAICASESPRLLYMNTETTMVATKGMPSAVYSVGTQAAGCFFSWPDIAILSLTR
jgi:hypothetical protein